jgi:hypothetical protein
MHGRNRWDAALGGSRHEGPAGVAVPARAEGRSGDEHVRSELLEIAEERRERFPLVLREVVVAAGDRRHDLQSLRGEAAAGADRALEPRRRGPRLVLAAQPGEELIDVVDCLHPERVPRLSWPI